MSAGGGNMQPRSLSVTRVRWRKHPAVYRKVISLIRVAVGDEPWVWVAIAAAIAVAAYVLARMPLP